MASFLDFTPRASRVLNSPPKRQSIWFQDRRVLHTVHRVSICHSMYDDKLMLKVVQDATASALNNQEAIATFLLLPNRMENSTNAFHKTCTDNKDVCTLLETSHKESALHATPLPAKQNTTPTRSNMEPWGIRILVVRNKAAR